MDHAIYTAMCAARHTLEQQAINANNMANASTNGFRAQLSALRAVPVSGPTIETRTMTVASTPGFDTTSGPMHHTERPLDVALQPQGFLAIRLPDGTEAYTRNGAIEISQDGQMRVQGNPLVGDAGPIEVPPQAMVSIASDGTISALNPSDPPNTIAQIGRIKLVKGDASNLVRGDDGFFHVNAATRQQTGATLPADADMRLMSGMLEGSNVNATASMVDMIANARRFEMQMKVIHSVDENEHRANQLLSVV